MGVGDEDDWMVMFRSVVMMMTWCVGVSDRFVMMMIIAIVAYRQPRPGPQWCRRPPVFRSLTATLKAQVMMPTDDDDDAMMMTRMTGARRLMNCAERYDGWWRWWWRTMTDDDDDDVRRPAMASGPGASCEWAARAVRGGRAA